MQGIFPTLCAFGAIAYDGGFAKLCRRDVFVPKIISATADTAPADSRFAIVVSRYNESITSKLLDGAVRTLTAAGVPDENIEVAWVPGAWEIPLIAAEAACAERFTAVICLGAVIRGETTHDEHINRHVSLSVGQISVDTVVPVAFGVFTCNTIEQAIHRAGGNVGNKGEEAAEAALEMVNLLTQLRSDTPEA